MTRVQTNLNLDPESRRILQERAEQTGRTLTKTVEDDAAIIPRICELSADRGAARLLLDSFDVVYAEVAEELRKITKGYTDHSAARGTDLAKAWDELRVWHEGWLEHCISLLRHEPTRPVWCDQVEALRPSDAHIRQAVREAFDNAPKCVRLRARQTAQRLAAMV